MSADEIIKHILELASATKVVAGAVPFSTIGLLAGSLVALIYWRIASASWLVRHV
jgi:hypothetical protein